MSTHVVTAARPWVLCPRCRVFCDRLTVDPAAVGIDDLHIRCPWCRCLSSVQAMVDAAAVDVCACGCPRAAHVAYSTSDGLPPGSSVDQHTVTRSAPCVGCGCVRVSGAHEVRLG